MRIRIEGPDEELVEKASEAASQVLQYLLPFDEQLERAWENTAVPSIVEQVKDLNHQAQVWFRRASLELCNAVEKLALDGDSQ